MNGLVEHFERHLGPIQHGWSSNAEGLAVPFQIIQLGGGTIEGVQTLVTLGLSNFPLCVGGTSRRLRQELMFMFRESEGPRTLPALLQQVAGEALERDQAYSVGEVIGPRNDLSAGSSLSALYVAMPVYLPDSFHVHESPALGSVVVGWLVPITSSEAAYVRVHGAPTFDHELARHDPDLLDFRRGGIV